MKKRRASDCWKYIAMLFIGVVIGFLISPIKHGVSGISMFNNNGARINENSEDKEIEE